MSNRSPSHRTGDASLHIFWAALPEAWVYRIKGQDYGIDVEVEIFDDDGRATGLIFLAQVKGTKNIGLARKVPISVDRLHYKASFETPSIIVRCCTRTKAIFWIWTEEALTQISGKGKSKSIKFSRQWDENSAETIRDVVARRRQLRRATQNEQIHLNVIHRGDTDFRFAAEAVLHNLNTSLPFLRRAVPDTEGALVLDVTFFEENINIAFGMTAGLQVEIDASEPQSLRSALQYGLMAACWHMGLTDRAREVARSCLGAHLITPFRKLAAIGVSALRQDADDALDLALMNGLHNRQDEYYKATVAAVMDGQHHYFEAEALRRFYVEAIEAQGEIAQTAPIYFSLANLYMMRGDLRRDFFCLNKARHLRPEYLNEAYFLSELAAALFHCGRYALAAKLYRKLYDLEPTGGNAFRLADAFFFTEHYESAMPYFHDALVKTQDEVLRAEAILKFLVSDGTGLIEEGDTQLGAIRAAFAPLEDELLDCLTEVFFTQQDEDLWAKSIWLAASGERLDAVELVMICAARAGGSAPYSRFRNIFGSRLQVEVLSQLDEMSFRVGRLLADWRPEWAAVDHIQQGGVEVTFS